ncbi:MAG: PTS sugar transporter subunit IIA [Fusobacterium gastrosuis]|uniref:PTS sugar transporter subunit IIA n=1 Tax=Fusobacterium TaxID=848 RepID=UPI0025BA43F8|nr:PTS sugar transporter subunit IIA [Fusobacterium sp.]MDD7392299.1 PTS sugar transporter subunit IIA [Fusobacteriaceae bacterium]MDY4011854.1 PTS sugar transporter subunit IIA [Fusobacterium gastrosuis]MCI5724646.1 PTS sugar transporter subunit IIA [Fusobacterium sp.]MCI7222995.1 PTS sugar transporter subunit IIA [Fusobacterium sp.]MDY5795876.1 PTS sugar transporter subunit IIA [Fusobacterium gastrosuis]
MKFSSYLDPKYVFTDLKADSKEEIIIEISEKIAEENNYFKSRKKEIIDSILKRENEISTCMGEGIFLPHARIRDFNDFIIAVAILKEGVEGEVAATYQKDIIKVVFLIVSDVLKNKNILKSMSVISKIALKHPEIMEEIKKEKNPRKIIELLTSEDIEIEHKIIAEDVLSPDIRPVHKHDTLEEVAKRLILERESAFPVVNENGELLGEITEKELIDFGLPDHLSLMQDINFLTVGEPFEEYLLNEDSTEIDEIYRKEIKHLIIDPKTPIMEICFKMVVNGIHRLYVVDDKKYCGMIKRSDIIKKVLHI